MRRFTSLLSGLVVVSGLLVAPVSVVAQQPDKADKPKPPEGDKKP